MKRKLPNAEELYKLYIEQGLPQKEIAERYGVSQPCVSQTLKKANISNGKRQPEGKEASRNKSRARLKALALGKLDEYGYKANKFNRSFFGQWSPEMAYVLGLVYADGHINKSGLHFGFGKKSFGILDNIRNLMECESEPKRVDNNSFPSRTMHLTSIEIVKDLNRIGLSCGKKSHIIKFPQMLAEYKRHFIRGYWDGDGCATSRQIKFCSACLEFLEDVASNLKQLSKRIELHQIRLVTDELVILPLSDGSIYTQQKCNHYPQGGQGYSTSHTLVYCSTIDREIIYHLFYDDVPKGQFSPREKDRFEAVLS